VGWRGAAPQDRKLKTARACGAGDGVDLAKPVSENDPAVGRFADSYKFSGTKFLGLRCGPPQALCYRLLRRLGVDGNLCLKVFEMKSKAAELNV
jgi:hypothetical protein